MANRIGDYMEQEGIKFLKGYNIIKVISGCFRFFSLKKKEAKLDLKPQKRSLPILKIITLEEREQDKVHTLRV